MKGRMSQFAALSYLLLLGGLALVGPYGALAWAESSALLEKRQAHIAELELQRADLSNNVDLLDPENADRDLAAELIRENLNVAHPDDYVMELKPRH
ncbi:septum formation initiator [Croceibacterium xixiisoli]